MKKYNVIFYNLFKYVYNKTSLIKWINLNLKQNFKCLKNEPFYDNSLTHFLLNRAFKSQRIGYDLFWLLKSEMSNLKYRYRFGFILEAYCRGIGSQIKDLLKQVEVVEKLSVLAQEIKNNPDNIALIKSAFMQETLNKTDYVETLSNFISPLNRSHLLGNIKYYFSFYYFKIKFCIY